MPAVSIILPTYNRARLVRCAIDTVFAQSMPDWELIVADDGSTDDTRQALSTIVDPRVRTLWLPRSANPSRVRNHAIRLARGKYLAFLDSDDLWAPRKLELQLALLGDRPGCRWSYTHCSRIDMHDQPYRDDKLTRHVWPEGWILEAMLKNPRNQMPVASVVAERALVDEVGGFDEDQLWCEDLDLFLRLAAASPVARLSEPLCFIRSHFVDDEHYSGDRVAESAYRAELFDKLSRRIADPRLRAICRRRRAEQSLALARFKAERGDHRGAFRTLASASAFSWSYPDWWWGALKTVGRPVVPEPALRLYRQLRP